MAIGALLNMQHGRRPQHTLQSHLLLFAVPRHYHLQVPDDDLCWRRLRCCLAHHVHHDAQH